MEKIRTFIAVRLSSPVTKQAAVLIRKLKASGATVRWVESDQLHLTLKFLGDVLNTQIPALCNCISSIARNHSPLDIDCQTAGAFPAVERPRTVWLGFSESPELVALQKEIDEGMYEMGFAPDRRRYQPHVTIGRVRQGGRTQHDLSELLKQHADFKAGISRIDEVIVFASFLDKMGPSYDVLGRAPLSK